MIESEATTELAITEARGAPAAAFLPLLAKHRPVALPVAVLVFSLLTALSAYIAVPLGVTPVPMTLQTLVVLLAGAFLGPVAGAASQLLYLGMGVAGFPVFAMGGAGLPWLFGPTGGYLMAFPLAAALTGWIAGRERGRLRVGLALVASTTVIFALGAGWLAVVTDRGFDAVIGVAVQPFLPGAVIKAAIAFVVIRQVKTRKLPR